jgi:hypothetical protein
MYAFPNVLLQPWCIDCEAAMTVIDFGVFKNASRLCKSHNFRWSLARDEAEMLWKKAIVTYLVIFYFYICNLPEGSDKYHDKSQSGQKISRSSLTQDFFLMKQKC